MATGIFHECTFFFMSCVCAVPAAQRAAPGRPAPRVPRQGGALARGGGRPGGLPPAPAAGREGLKRPPCACRRFPNKRAPVGEPPRPCWLVFLGGFQSAGVG